MHERSFFNYVPSNVNNVIDLVVQQASKYMYPMDYFYEERLFSSNFFEIYLGHDLTGYAAVKDGLVTGFYIKPEYFRYAGNACEDFMDLVATDNIAYLTQDALFISLLSDWVYDNTVYEQCIMTDLCGDSAERDEAGCFRIVREEEETARIGMQKVVPDRISAKGQYYRLLEDGQDVAYGFMSKGRTSDSGFIFVCSSPENDEMLMLKMLVLMKQEAIHKGLVPIASCGYYEADKRRLYEQGNMASIAKAVVARLIERKKVWI